VGVVVAPVTIIPQIEMGVLVDLVVVEVVM
jgi:hypothetical protein